MSDSVRPHRRQPMRLSRPWDSPGKTTGVGCHCLLQCRKVKSESEVTESCPTLSNPMDCGPPGSSIHGIFQARVLEWVAISFSRGSSPPRDRTQVSALQTDALPSEPPGKPYMQLAAAAKSLQSCPTLCDPIDSNPPGSPVPGILQARILDWVAISFSNA